jgi:hypothetical protein
LELNNNKKITKKDIIYWFIISDLVLIMIGMIVAFVFIKVPEPSLIIDQISFASSITSIMLAVIAIVYAFLQTNETSRQNTIVTSNLEKLDSKVTEFITIKQDFQVFRESDIPNMNTTIGEIKNDLYRFREEIKANPIQISEEKENGDANQQLSDRVNEYQEKMLNQLADFEYKLNEIGKSKSKAFAEATVISPYVIKIRIPDNISKTDIKKMLDKGLSIISQFTHVEKISTVTTNNIIHFYFRCEQLSKQEISNTISEFNYEKIPIVYFERENF